MKKLSASQVASISRQHGVFDESAWLGCLAYLHRLLADPDPSNTEQWTDAMTQIRMLVDWAVHETRTRFGALAQSCVSLASQRCMSAESLHELNAVPCVFSGRKRPRLYHTGDASKAECASVRVQCHFTWWAHHEQTGMECPHRSETYVYEAQYSYLIKGVSVLGHLPQLLRHESMSVPADSTFEEFQSHPKWDALYRKINNIMYVVWATLAL
jgi:hypothetical protein